MSMNTLLNLHTILYAGCVIHTSSQFEKVVMPNRRMVLTCTTCTYSYVFPSMHALSRLMC